MSKTKGIWMLLLAVCLAASSCTTQKRLTYFRGVDAASADSINKYFTTAHESRVIIGDMLTIFVTGPDPETVIPFNMPISAYNRPGSDQMTTSQSYQTYMVDVDGNIDFPILGDIHVAGLTKSQVKDTISAKLKPYLKNAIVSVNFVNYKVSVMGEVNSPGQYTITNERVSIPDALSLAGDLTPYGKRDNLLLIRENGGRLEFQRLNLNEADIFTSPYYFLQQNDILYVSPNKVKAVSSSNVSIYLSVISTLVTLTTLIISLTK